MLMKKILLFFMSMFLVLGTSMAKDEEVKDFNSPVVTPDSENYQTSVWNIRLTFSKEITVVQSEVSIDVVNNQTNDVVKITNCCVDEWDTYSAVFSFEKKVVEGKDGEELVDQPIEAPGTYTYTIPSGIIKSVDGEEFTGKEYSFTIVNTFALEDWSPKETTKLETIVLTFDREIAEVKLPTSGLAVLDNYWMPVTNVSNADINDDKKSVTLTLESPITYPGTYNLDLYQGVFISENAISEYSTIYFSVIDPTPSFSTTYNDGDKVKELSNIFEITFKNVEEVVLLEKTLTVYLPDGSSAEGTAKCENKKITVTFDQQFTEEGDYLFYIPQGMFTMDGVENEAREILVNLFTFTITPLEVVSVTPESGAVSSLERIIVKFNQVVSLSWTDDWMSQPSREITLTCGDQKYTLTNDASGSAMSDQVEYLVNAKWTGYEYTSSPITVAGTYTLNLADIIVDYAAEMVTDQYGTYVGTWHGKKGSCEGTYTWTIAGEDNAVKFTAAEAEGQAVYDLLGRRIEKITTAGIYIVNGHKMIIK